jgi:hypothetical protein
MYACEMYACEMHAYEMHARKRATPMRYRHLRRPSCEIYALIRCTPLRCTPFLRLGSQSEPLDRDTIMASRLSNARLSFAAIGWRDLVGVCSSGVQQDVVSRSTPCSQNMNSAKARQGGSNEASLIVLRCL